MIRRRTLRFALACTLVSAGVSHASLASSQSAASPSAQPLTSGQPAPTPEQPPAPVAPAQPSQPPPAQPAPEQPAQPSQPPSAPVAPAQPSQPPAAQPSPEQPAQPSQPPSAPAAPSQPSQPPSAPVAPAPVAPSPVAPAPIAPAPIAPAKPIPAPPTRPAQSVQFARTQTAQLAPTQPAPAAPAQPAPTPAPATGQPAQPSPYAPTMQAGGLAPPPPMDEKTAQTPSTPTTPDKPDDDDDDDDKDSGRGLDWVWLNVEGGFQHVGLETFDFDEENFTAGFIPTTATGAAVGVGLGAQLFFITLGARGRLGLLDAWQYFTVGGELGLRFPLGNFEPHVNIGGGYAAVGSFSDSAFGADSSVSIRGFYARAGGGLDYFITPVFSVGAAASWEFTAMTRPGLDPTEIANIESNPSIDTIRQQQAKLLAFEGSGYGSAFTLTAVLGLHL